MWVPVVVRRLANCYTPFTFTYFTVCVLYSLVKSNPYGRCSRDQNFQLPACNNCSRKSFIIRSLFKNLNSFLVVCSSSSSMFSSLPVIFLFFSHVLLFIFSFSTIAMSLLLSHDLHVRLYVCYVLFNKYSNVYYIHYILFSVSGSNCDLIFVLKSFSECTACNCQAIHSIYPQFYLKKTRFLISNLLLLLNNCLLWPLLPAS